MEEFGRMRMVGDAVILERAARILERRKPQYERIGWHEMFGFLGRVARELRQAAEFGE